MSYCSIEDAWKNSDSLTDQFKLKKKNIENFSNNDEDLKPIKFDEAFDYNKNDLDFNIDNDFINDINNNYYDQNNHYDQDNYQNNYQNNYQKNNQNNNNHHFNQNINHNKENLDANKTNNYQNVFICDDFLDHLETCKICRMKMRNRFRSNIVEKFDNLII